MNSRIFKPLLTAIALASLLLLTLGSAIAQEPIPTASPEAAIDNVNADSSFTYQGQLKFNGNLYDGICDFSFYLYDAGTGGSIVAGPYYATNTVVSNGLFSAPINYANWGPQRWLQINVRCPTGSGSYVPLSPREKITAAPYANTLRPGAEITNLDTNGNTLSDVYISYGSQYGIYASGYYTGTVAVKGFAYNQKSQTGVLGQTSRVGNFYKNYGVVGLASNGLLEYPDYDAGGYFSGPNGLIAKASSDTSNGWGVLGLSTATGGIGVRGNASATTGTNYGVVGLSSSVAGTGVFGEVITPTGSTTGVYGLVSSGNGTGVVGVKQSASTFLSGFWTPAVLGSTNTGNGVIGNASANYADGVIGMTSGTTSTGVYGYTTGASSHAVEGYASQNSSWAGFFTGAGGGVYISVPTGYWGLNVAGGTKNAVVATDSGARLLYSEESTQVWFSDYGFGKLDNGTAVMTIDPVFAQTVSLTDPYHVFVQAYGDAELYVSNRTPTTFEVHLRGSGDAAVEFSYRIVALRQGYETTRLESAPWANNDVNLYPENQSMSTPTLPNQGGNGNGSLVPPPTLSDPSHQQSPGSN